MVVAALPTLLCPHCKMPPPALPGNRTYGGAKRRTFGQCLRQGQFVDCAVAGRAVCDATTFRRAVQRTVRAHRQAGKGTAAMHAAVKLVKRRDHTIRRHLKYRAGGVVGKTACKCCTVEVTVCPKSQTAVRITAV